MSHLYTVKLALLGNLYSMLVFKTPLVYSGSYREVEVHQVLEHFPYFCLILMLEGSCLLLWMKGSSLEDMVKFSSTDSFSIKSKRQSMLECFLNWILLSCSVCMISSSCSHNVTPCWACFVKGSHKKNTKSTCSPASRMSVSQGHLFSAVCHEACWLPYKTFCASYSYQHWIVVVFGFLWFFPAGFSIKVSLELFLT